MLAVQECVTIKRCPEVGMSVCGNSEWQWVNVNVNVNGKERK